MISVDRSLDQWRALEPEESEQQTLGCRHSNPNICRNNATPGKCAFVRKDNICQLPPKSWKRIYLALKSGAKGKSNV